MIEVVGPAGIGKTRLVSEARSPAGRIIVVESDRRSVCRVDPYGAFRPLVRSLLGTPADADRSAVGTALLGWIAEHHPALGPWAPLVALVADADVPATASVDRLDADFVRTRLNASVVELIERIAPRGTVCVVEDAHWLDDASLSLLDQLAGQAGASELLWVITRRPGEPVLDASRSVHRIELAPLDHDERARSPSR